MPGETSISEISLSGTRPIRPITVYTRKVDAVVDGMKQLIELINTASSS